MQNSKAINVNISFNEVDMFIFLNNMMPPTITKINKNITNTDLHIFLFLPSIDLEITEIQTPIMETSILI